MTVDQLLPAHSNYIATECLQYACMRVASLMALELLTMSFTLMILFAGCQEGEGCSRVRHTPLMWLATVCKRQSTGICIQGPLLFWLYCCQKERLTTFHVCENAHSPCHFLHRGFM